MNMIYDHKAAKKATNLSINSNLLSKARDLGINLSATLEHALETEIRQSARKEWLKNNKTALDNCNALTSENGLFADKHRKF
jgi:antitoxin CcdA